MKKPKIGLITTGGTLASMGRDSLDLLDYSETGRVLGSDELLSHIPEMAELFEVQSDTFSTIDSTSVSPASWRNLELAVRKTLQHDASGVVVSHDTASLEETAYYLDLVIDDECPVVFTGAMRPISSISSDGPSNLINAAQVAAGIGSRNRGALVVFNGDIHAARFATKVDPYAVDAFRASNGGPVGRVLPGKVQFFMSGMRSPTFASAVDLPRVDIVASYAGADGHAVMAAREHGSSGIVVSGFAASEQINALKLARSRGIEIIQASRSSSSSVLLRNDLSALGFIAAGCLTPQKARILATLAINAGMRGDELQKAFDMAA